MGVSGGSLNITAIAKSETCGGVTQPYASGLIDTYGKFNFTYGYMEAKIWLPGSGSISDWPAFWADGQNWPTDGEIDVMEGLGGSAQAHFHYSGGALGPLTGPGTYTGGWHTFAADWEPGSITYYYDGSSIGTFTSGITSSPMYLIVNLAVSSSPVAPATMKVDYVRVWQKSATTTTTTVPVTTTTVAPTTTTTVAPTTTTVPVTTTTKPVVTTTTVAPTPTTLPPVTTTTQAPIPPVPTTLPPVGPPVGPPVTLPPITTTTSTPSPVAVTTTTQAPVPTTLPPVRPPVGPPVTLPPVSPPAPVSVVMGATVPLSPSKVVSKWTATAKSRPVIETVSIYKGAKCSVPIGHETVRVVKTTSHVFTFAAKNFRTAGLYSSRSITTNSNHSVDYGKCVSFKK